MTFQYSLLLGWIAKPANVVTAAIARELAGFIWAIARHVPPAAG